MPTTMAAANGIANTNPAHPTRLPMRPARRLSGRAADTPLCAERAIRTNNSQASVWSRVHCCQPLPIRRSAIVMSGDNLFKDRKCRTTWRRCQPGGTATCGWPIHGPIPVYADRGANVAATAVASDLCIRPRVAHRPEDGPPTAVRILGRAMPVYGMSSTLVCNPSMSCTALISGSWVGRGHEPS